MQHPGSGRGGGGRRQATSTAAGRAAGWGFPPQPAMPRVAGRDGGRGHGAGGRRGGRNGNRDGANVVSAGARSHGIDGWKLRLVNELCNNRTLSSSVNIVGQIVLSISVERVKIFVEGQIIDGVLLCKGDTSGREELDCSFMIVGTEADARMTFERALSVTHKRIAKVYCILYSEGLGRYLVCFERVTPLVSATELMYDPSITNQNQPVPSWLYTIRETFQAIEELHSMGFGVADTSNMNSYVYAQDVSADLPSEDTVSNERGSKVIKLLRTMTFPSDGTLTKCQIDCIKHYQREQYLQFLEAHGANNLVEYRSFQYLVRSGASVEVILKHPFLLETSEERISSVASINESLFDLSSFDIKNLDTFLDKEFSNVSWRTIVANNKSAFGTIDTVTGYGDKFHVLASFVRNFVEHLWDGHPDKHVDYDAVEKMIFKLFPGRIGWLYTCVHA